MERRAEAVKGAPSKKTATERHDEAVSEADGYLAEIDEVLGESESLNT